MGARPSERYSILVTKPLKINPHLSMSRLRSTRWDWGEFLVSLRGMGDKRARNRAVQGAEGVSDSLAA